MWCRDKELWRVVTTASFEGRCPNGAGAKRDLRPCQIARLSGMVKILRHDLSTPRRDSRRCRIGLYRSAGPQRRLASTCTTKIRLWRHFPTSQSLGSPSTRNRSPGPRYEGRSVIPLLYFASGALARTAGRNQVLAWPPKRSFSLYVHSNTHIKYVTHHTESSTIVPSSRYNDRS